VRSFWWIVIGQNPETPNHLDLPSVNYDQLNILEVLMMLASRQVFQILSDQINPEKFGLHGLLCMKVCRQIVS
jgi:hypothetical protein